MEGQMMLKFDDGTYKDGLQRAVEILAEVEFLLNCLINILMTVGIIAVICVICRRNAFKYLPWKLKIALICWLLVALCYDTYEVLCEK